MSQLTVEPTTVRGANTMKAAILAAQQQPLVIAEVDLPPLTVGQVRVKVAYSGICGTQVEEISGKRGEDRYLPHLLGHEGSGVVLEVGPGVRKVRAGDRVVLHWMKGQGIEAVPPTYHRAGTKINAGWVTTFNEQSIVSENRLTPIAADIPLDVACLLGCAVTTGLGLIFHEASMTPGQSIVVFGAGGIGLNVIQGAALVNADPIVAVDLHEQKLQQAVAFGATHTVNARETPMEAALMELSHGRGFEVAVDTTGEAEVFQAAYGVTAKTGKTVMAGVQHARRPIMLHPHALHFGRQIIGSHGGATQPDIDIPRYLALYHRGKLKLEEQITHRFALHDINEALDMVRQGSAGRCLLVLS